MVDTLGEALDAGWRLTVRCARFREGLKAVSPCLGRQELSLSTLVWTHGRRCPVGYLQGKLRCPKCGSLHVMQMWIAPPEIARARAR